MLKVKSNSQLKLYSAFSLIILFSFPFVLIFSTTVDRILIYFFAIQLLVFSQLENFVSSNKIKYFINLSIGAFYFIIMLVWLLYGKYSNHWIPYENYFFLSNEK